MNEIIRHEKYKELCEHVYQNDIKNCPKDTIPLYVHENKKNGFFARAYKYQDRIVIVFRGSELDKSDGRKTDGRNDINMGIHRIPNQAHDALLFTKQIKQVMKTKYPNYKLDLTGHSLGGSLAQYTHVLVKGINETVTFNPYGTRKTLEKYFENNTSQSPTDKITNYCASHDLISNTFSKKFQIGICYEINVDSIPYQDILSKLIRLNKKNLYLNTLDKVMSYQKLVQDSHYTENMKPLSERKKMQKNKGQKTISENSSSNCTGSYMVNGYTRSDGTKVKEYIRTCGKHNKMSMEERIKGQAKYKGKRFQDIPLDELEEAIGYFV